MGISDGHQQCTDSVMTASPFILSTSFTSWPKALKVICLSVGIYSEKCLKFQVNIQLFAALMCRKPTGGQFWKVMLNYDGQTDSTIIAQRCGPLVTWVHEQYVMYSIIKAFKALIPFVWVIPSYCMQHNMMHLSLLVYFNLYTLDWMNVAVVSMPEVEYK